MSKNVLLKISSDIIIFRYRTLHKHAYILQIMSVSATDYLEDDTLGRGINQLKVMKT
jgi:hypothetical protein